MTKKSRFPLLLLALAILTSASVASTEDGKRRGPREAGVSSAFATTAQLKRLCRATAIYNDSLETRDERVVCDGTAKIMSAEHFSVPSGVEYFIEGMLHFNRSENTNVVKGYLLKDGSVTVLQAMYMDTF
jgi:hypothetical protein